MFQWFPILLMSDFFFFNLLGVLVRIGQLTCTMPSAKPLKGTAQSLQFSFKLSLLLLEVFPITPIWYEEAESTLISQSKWGNFALLSVRWSKSFT